MMVLRKRAPRTLRNYSDALTRLAEMGNLDDVEVMGKIVSGLEGVFFEQARASSVSVIDSSGLR